MTAFPSSSSDFLLPWEEASWKSDVEVWLQSVFTRRDWPWLGEAVEVHHRSWSVILKVPSPVGDLFFKACSPALMHEPALTRALSTWQPQVVLPLIAVDAPHGWMLMPDGGLTLRKQFESGASLSTWLDILPVLARMQIDLLPHVGELLSLGIIDRRTPSLTDLFDGLLKETAALRIDQKDGLTRAEFGQLQEDIPIFKNLCGELAACGIPDSLEHDDFHDANIFYDQGSPVFFDWGETCLSHPFFSMVVGLNSIAYRFDLQPGSEEWCRLRDAYLEPWSAFADRETRLRAFDLSQQVGAVNRALTWHRVISRLPARWQEQDADAVPGWLQEYLQRRKRYSSD